MNSGGNSMNQQDLARQLEGEWAKNPRWQGVRRDYAAADVVRLRGSLEIEHTLARRGAEKLWRLLCEEDYIHCLGALTGGQAVQQVKAGIKAIYLSGWQVAADANTSETTKMVELDLASFPNAMLPKFLL